MQPLTESEKRNREEETPVASGEATAPKRQRRIGRNGEPIDRTDYMFVCPETGCGARFKHASGLLRHSSVHVKSLPRPPREEWQHECAEEKCEKRFLTAGDLKAHIKNVHADKLFTCEEEDCGKVFAIASKLAIHQLVHSEERSVPCEEKGCGKSFKSKEQLKTHMLIHSDERPYVCTIEDCDARFKQPSNLVAHQRYSHTAARPFKCAVAGCEKDYQRKISLTAHMRVHDDEKPFKCEHEEYACPDSRCGGETFGTVEAFTKHVNVVHDRHHLKAQYISSGGISCTYASTRSDNLAVHVNRMHNNERSRVVIRREMRFRSVLEAAGFRYERNVEITFSGIRDTSHQRTRIDFQVYGRADGAVVIVEVDQYQHRDQRYSQTCERRRLLDVVMAFQINPRLAGARILWIRYNPDTYKVNGKRVTKLLTKREEQLTEVIKDMALPADGRLLTLVYMFYDSVTDPTTGKSQACVLLDDDEVPQMLRDCAIPAIV